MNQREPETHEEVVQHLERMPPRLAVNVSLAQLRRGDFVDRMEITESGPSDFARSRAQLKLVPKSISTKGESVARRR